jgi:hypothetical protein
MAARNDQSYGPAKLSTRGSIEAAMLNAFLASVSSLNLLKLVDGHLSVSFAIHQDDASMAASGASLSSGMLRGGT